MKNLNLLFSIFLFSGCQNVFNKKGTVTGGMNNFIVDFTNNLYPFFSFLGLIILAISINTFFISNIQGKQRFITGFTELFLALFLILSKNIINYIFT